ncbi:hypothetical protein ACMFGU_09560 [Morganella morganii]|uniref:hypothetical protein n=1 Tax=Morganella morganii TaxID=582 RepID=UPI003CF69A95
MKRTYIKTAGQKQDVCLRIVRNLRQLDSFTMKMASLSAELNIVMATTFVKMMEDIGSVHVSHKRGKQVYYVFDDYAVSKIKAHFSSFPDKKRTGTKVETPVSEQEACCG